MFYITTQDDTRQNILYWSLCAYDLVQKGFWHWYIKNPNKHVQLIWNLWYFPFDFLGSDLTIYISTLILQQDEYFENMNQDDDANDRDDDDEVDYFADSLSDLYP